MLIFIILYIQFIINTIKIQITRSKSYVAWCPGRPAVLVSVSVAASAEVLTKENIHSCVSTVSSQSAKPHSNDTKYFNFRNTFCCVSSDLTVTPKSHPREELLTQFPGITSIPTFIGVCCFSVTYDARTVFPTCNHFSYQPGLKRGIKLTPRKQWGKKSLNHKMEHILIIEPCCMS